MGLKRCRFELPIIDSFDYGSYSPLGPSKLGLQALDAAIARVLCSKLSARETGPVSLLALYFHASTSALASPSSGAFQKVGLRTRGTILRGPSSRFYNSIRLFSCCLFMEE
jgi:hypothetical protein